MSAAGIVLAAGAGTRFGGPKQLAELDGEPLAQRALDVASSVPALTRIILVLGAYADVIEERLVPGRAEIVRCANWAEGISASLRCGFEAATGSEWVVVTLADEPGLPAAAIERILAASRFAPVEVGAVRATWSGRPGHPVAVRATLGPQVAELHGDRGARDLLESIPYLEVACEDLGDPHDIDTPEQLEELEP